LLLLVLLLLLLLLLFMLLSSLVILSAVVFASLLLVPLVDSFRFLLHLHSSILEPEFDLSLSQKETMSD